MSLTADRCNDPVCGMIVDKATALQAERAGETFYFCSDHCRQKFLAASADAAPADNAACGSDWTCGTPLPSTRLQIIHLRSLSPRN